MKERPILFSGEMVRSILEGRKTMTRRVVKPLPELKYVETQYVQDRGIDCVESNRPEFQSDVITSYCPYGQPGDRLWVREKFAINNGNDGTSGLIYAEGYSVYTGKWKPSIFMPRWASRITLEIVSVKVERIQDITEADSISEGMPKRSFVFETPAKAFFRSLWNELNSKRGFGWDVNPWVWVIEFRRIKP